MTVAKDDKIVISRNKSAVFKYLAYIKGRLRSASLDVKAALAQAYTKSLVLYFGVQLIAADVLKTAQVEAWEKEALRQLHLLPRDLKRTAISNLTDLGRPLKQLLEELSLKAKRASDNQQRLAFTNSDRPHTEKRPNKTSRTYIPRILAS